MKMNMRFHLAASIFLLTSQVIFAQEFKSIHQQEYEIHKNTPTTPDLLGIPGTEIKPLNLKLRKAKRLHAAIFGYLPYWSTSDYLRYGLLSHVAAFSVEVNTDGSLGNDHGWPWTGLINQAHSRGVKVILVATLFDGAKINRLITSANSKQRFFENIRKKILEGAADGVNIDFEGSNTTVWRAQINAFMAELTNYLHREIPGSEISFAGPAVNWGGSWDLAGLAASCDYIFIMGYDFYGSWSTSSGPNAPLTGGSINITNTVNNQYGLVSQNNPEKLILGVPYYGLHWQTFSEEPYASVINWVGAKFYNSAQAGALTYGTQWDSESQTPWYRWNDGSNWNQIWFDNDSSLALKYNLARVKNLKGVGMWALGYDGNRQELWNVLDKYFGSGLEPVPDTPLSFRVLSGSNTSLRVQFEASKRATGYFIYKSEDGISFTDSIFVSTNNAVLANLKSNSLYFVRVKAVNSSGLSQATEVLAGIPSQEKSTLLIVNGFDRTSGTTNPLNYIRQHGRAIAASGFPFSSTSNEAIYRSKLALQNFEIIDWILGDESTADDTFNPIEQDSVKAFLRRGGKLFVSGAEIGWDLEQKGSAADRAFYANFLKAQYINDAPNGRKATYYTAEPVSGTIWDGLGRFSFDNGSHGTFDVDWPDAIVGAKGGITCLQYVNVDVTTAGGAGVYFQGTFPNSTKPGKLVHLAIPFETIYPESSRNAMMQQVLDFFTGVTTGIAENSTAGPESFRVFQNYPNPFNPRTHIAFELPDAGQIHIEILNNFGQQVRIYEKDFATPGTYTWIWEGKNNSGRQVASGVYFYRVIFISQNGKRFSQTRKMILLE